MVIACLFRHGRKVRHAASNKWRTGNKETEIVMANGWRWHDEVPYL